MKFLAIYFVLFVNYILLGQFQIDTTFDGANVKEVNFIKLVAKKKNLNIYKVDIITRPDPANPIDSTLKPSSRWFYFGIENVKGYKLYLNFINTDPALPFYSYDNKNFKRVSYDKKKKLFYIQPTKNKIYLSYFIPYTDKNLINTEKLMEKNHYVKIDTIGFSVSKLPIKMYTITNFKISDSLKRKVWIHSRIHTSEAPSSFIVDNFIHLLLSNNHYYQEILNNVVFYIVPFTNPDGVKYGLSRSNLQGINMEINWNRPDSLTAVELSQIKKKFLELNSKHKFDIVFNSHSQIENRVIYWLHHKSTLNEKLYKNQILFAYLGTDEKYFYPPFEHFSDISPKYLEGLCWLINGDTTVALTFETSYAYYNTKKKGETVNLTNLKILAKNILNSFNDYLMIPNKYRLVIDNDTTQSISDYHYFYFGENYLLKNKGDKIVYKLYQNLLGNYKVYKWDIDKNNFYGWKFIKKIALKKGNKDIILESTRDNEFWDAILLVKD